MSKIKFRQHVAALNQPMSLLTPGGRDPAETGGSAGRAGGEHLQLSKVAETC